MRIDLSGKTALVTGSTGGIGFAIAERLADAGASVVLNGRSPATVADAQSRLHDAVPAADVHGIAADVATDEGAHHLVENAGDVDILVNNLGIFGSADPLEISDDEWRRYFDVNVLSAVRLTRLLLPGMTIAGGAGSSTSRATPRSSSPPR